MFLVTRDIDASLKTADILQSYGFSVFIEPIMKLQFLPDVLISSQLYRFLAEINTNKKKRIILIITSKNALKFSGINDFFKTIDQYLSRVIIIGKFAQEDEYIQSILSNYKINYCNNVNELYNYVLFNCNKEYAILYISGEDITREIHNELSNQGYKAFRIIAYKMIAANNLSNSLIKMIKDHQIKYVLIYSTRGAKIFAYLMRKNELCESMKNLTFFVLSSKIASFINDGHIVVSDAPNNESLINTIIKYLS